MKDTDKTRNVRAFPVHLSMTGKTYSPSLAHTYTPGWGSFTLFFHLRK